MFYWIEKVYALVGWDDKVTTVTFKSDSDAQKLFGNHITVVFLYTQHEREKLDQLIKDPLNVTQGFVKAKNLLTRADLSKDKNLKLAEEGINTDDIASMFFFGQSDRNTFHSQELRTITKIEVPIHIQPKGQDLDWMYGLSNRYVKDGIGLSPRERAFYLAGKFYYEAEELTESEFDEIFTPEITMDPKVEWEYLRIKYNREEAGDEEKKRLSALLKIKNKDDMELLDKYLKEAGYSLFKLAKENIDAATELLTKVNLFQEGRLNVTGKTAIYIDLDRYLHIYMRHVKELKVNKHFEHKDNFQWKEEDVRVVMKKVIEIINDEIQEFFTKNSGKRYSRFGSKSIYFEGDYYTLHIDVNGRISTFYKNRKVHEK